MLTPRQQAAKQRRLAREIRTIITKQAAAEFSGKLDPRIRAMHWGIRVGDNDTPTGKVTLFSYRDTLAVAGLVRQGVLPSQAAAVVGNDYAFATKLGEKFEFPHDGNWDPCDLLTLGDGTKWLIFLDETPALDHSQYDCWALRSNGEAVEISDYDPTQKLTGVCEYRHLCQEVGAE